MNAGRYRGSDKSLIQNDIHAFSTEEYLKHSRYLITTGLDWFEAVWVPRHAAPVTWEVSGSVIYLHLENGCANCDQTWCVFNWTAESELKLELESVGFDRSGWSRSRSWSR